MRQTMRVVGMSMACAAVLQASGYKIPEQSLKGTALGAANVAAVNGADANYYNPANMVWMDNAYHVEGALTYINLPKVKFANSGTGADGESKVEHFLMPSLHVVTPEYYENWRFGFSTVAPGGLSKRWNSPYQKTFAEEFTLRIIEANPTAAYKINDQLALGFGVRMVYTDGVVKSDGNLGFGAAKRDLTGDSIDYGYNLALAYRPTSELKLAATYRSKVDLTVKGDAKLYHLNALQYDGSASVTIPLPATLALAAAYTMDKTTVELVYERVYWSAYKNLDFNYGSTIANPVLVAMFDNPSAKNWKDSNTYRLGITHEYSDKLTLMAGYSYDETPVPDSSLGFELPDADAQLYSFGFSYKIRPDITVGLAYLYSDKKVRSVNNTYAQGKFTGSGAHLVTTGITYRF
ncbi:porin [Sulfurospirillum sp. T05]|uniref:Porin n=1 Tax=Sulfurospirillum tamanense TaxID=2813362 RepID=A0ABS2WRB2_9BACT|nr:porin [Sulfurospirillum tamanensis]MBN2963938.1 porin [Sulfurospirillum tamanensis]